MGETQFAVAGVGMGLVGKYVCFRNSQNDGFCWGRVKAETQVNTVDGKQGALILTDMLVCCCAHGSKSLIAPRGDRVIQTRMLNLQTDVIEKGEVFRDMSAEDMFLLVMGGEVDTAGYSKDQMMVYDLFKKGGFSVEDIRDAVQSRMQKKLITST